jgi:hypothetical protein
MKQIEEQLDHIRPFSKSSARQWQDTVNGKGDPVPGAKIMVLTCHGIQAQHRRFKAVLSDEDEAFTALPESTEGKGPETRGKEYRDYRRAGIENGQRQSQ